VENGEAIIDTAIKNFGRIDILINNAGILRDISFKNMQDKDWDLINTVHIYGAYKVSPPLSFELDALLTAVVRTCCMASLQETKVRSGY
jgi:NAD(P)-dependent dehydrogenase (short-subunit alcohol dehydrogenase family)